MGLAEKALLAAELNLSGNFASNLHGAERALSGFDAKLSSSSTRAFRAGQQIGTGIQNVGRIAAVGVGLLASQVALGVRSLIKLEEATSQTEAVLKSTGGVAGQTADSVRILANKMEGLNATISDEVIQSGENLLLTFTNIRTKAFEPALLAALNMNKALGGDEQSLEARIRIVGKALNDPIKGLTALQRVGITFTATQKDQIKAAIAAGDAFKAQGVILAELDKRFGGSFAKGGTTIAGQFASVKDAVDDLQRTLATALLPALSKIALAVRKALTDPAVIAGVRLLGDKVAELFSDANLKTGADALGNIFRIARDAAPAIASAAAVTGRIIGAAVSLFRSLPPEIQSLAVAGLAINKLTGGLVTNLAGGLIENVVGKLFRSLKSAVVNVTGTTVIVEGAGVPGAGGAVAGTGSKLGRVASVVGKVFLVGAAIGVFAELVGVLREQTAANQKQAADLTTQTGGFTKVVGIADMQKALDGILAYDRKLSTDLTAEGAAFQFNIDGVRDAVRHQEDVLRASIADAIAQRQALERGTNELGHRPDEPLSKAIVASSGALLLAQHQQTAALQSLLRSQTAAILAGNAQRHADFVIEQGILGKVKPTDPKSFAFHIPQIKFLESHTNKQALTVADAFTRRFATGSSSYDRSSAKAANALEALRDLQRRFLAHGDTKSAAAIGRDIHTMREVLKTASHGTTRAIQTKKLAVTTNITVPITTKTYVNGRLFDASIGRYVSIFRDNGGGKI